MVSRESILEFMTKTLSPERFSDYAPNGMQVEGKPHIERVCTAVTASLAVIEEAVAQKADMLLVHHGYFWRGEAPAIVGMKRERIAKLLQANLNLLAYHLPLDCHPELGNNVQLAKVLGFRQIQGHMVDGVTNLLWKAKLPEPMTPDALSACISSSLGRSPLHLSAGDMRNIQTVAWCTGGAQNYCFEAKALGADAYLSGECSERNYHEAKELDMHYYACGHHATERYGIQALGERLAAEFPIQHHFIDIDNPV